jgi:hypothetical protein
MTEEFYLRLNDPLAPVYAVNFETNTYRMVASKIGVVQDIGGTMPDNGAVFRTERFTQVWPNGTDRLGVVRYTRDNLAEGGT